MSTILRKVFTGLAMTCIILALLSVVGFVLGPPKRAMTLPVPTVAGFIGTYEFYIPTRLTRDSYLWLSETDNQLTGAYGFRMPVPNLNAKPPNVTRVAFLGGSTTQGGYRPYAQTAIEILNASVGGYEYLNAACSSYSTHQCAEIMDRLVKHVQPDIVFVYEGWNDMTVAADGYSDNEKTAAIKRRAGGSFVPSGLANLCGWMRDAVRPDKPRVSPDEMRENYARIKRSADACGARAVVATRPASLNPPQQGWGGAANDYWSRLLGVTNSRDIYLGIQSQYVRVQREQGDVFDLAEVVALIEREGVRHGIQVYYPDACHITPWANQRLGELVALFLCPTNRRAEVETYIASDEYRRLTARTMWNEFEPAAAIYYYPKIQTDEAIARTLDMKQRFEACRWGGSETNFEVKMQGLARLANETDCDIGVMLQMVRVSIYMNRAATGLEFVHSVTPKSGAGEKRKADAISSLRGAIPDALLAELEKSK